MEGGVDRAAGSQAVKRARFRGAAARADYSRKIIVLVLTATMAVSSAVFFFSVYGAGSHHSDTVLQQSIYGHTHWQWEKFKLSPSSNRLPLKMKTQSLASVPPQDSFTFPLYGTVP
jgi:hypothetical protein